jgi:serine protease Do
VTFRRALTLAALASTVSCRGLAHRQPGDESVSVPLDGSTAAPPARPPSGSSGASKSPASPKPQPRFDAGAPPAVGKNGTPAPAAPAPLTARLEIPAEARALSRAFSNVAKAMAPSVVRVDVEVAHPDRDDDGDDDGVQRLPPGLRKFFQFGEPGDMPPQKGTGSGVLLDGAGNIVTNRHVVSKATKVSVTFSDGTELPAHVVGADQQTDVAVVRLDKPPAAGLVAARLGDSDKLDVGEWVLAVGSPLGLDQTVTAGIVSGKGKVGRHVQMSGERVRSYIQTDAKINPGNSGGPLVNLGAEVVGINTLINTGPGGAYGFAIPINQVRRVAQALIKEGRVRYPYLGVLLGDLKELAPEARAALKKGGGVPAAGAYVSGLTPGSPAVMAGLRPGDVIVAIDGRPMESAGDVVDYVSAQAIGGQVKIDYVRDGKKTTIGAVLGELPGGDLATAGAGESVAGLALQTVTPPLAESLGLKRDVKGAAITEVAPGGAAEKAGLQAGEVIVEVDRRPTPTAEDALKALRGQRKGGHLLRVRSPAGARFVTLESSSG